MDMADRRELLEEIWKGQDLAYDLMVEYDSLPHHYGESILYQAEGHIIDLIAAYPGVTTTELATILKKTASACSQIVRKLRDKGLVEQSRNRDNNRLYNLTLTVLGFQIYKDHQTFTDDCRERTFQLLQDCTDEELVAHAKVQARLNKAYAGDIERSREKFTK